MATVDTKRGWRIFALLPILVVLFGILAQDVLAQSKVSKADSQKIIGLTTGYINAIALGDLSKAYRVFAPSMQNTLSPKSFRKLTDQGGLMGGGVKTFETVRLVGYGPGNENIALDYFATYKDGKSSCGFFVWTRTGQTFALSRLETNILPARLSGKSQSFQYMLDMGCKALPAHLKGAQG